MKVRTRIQYEDVEDKGPIASAGCACKELSPTKLARSLPRVFRRHITERLPWAADLVINLKKVMPRHKVHGKIVDAI